MRTANYVFSTVSIVLGIALLLFVLTQTAEWRLRTVLWVPDWSVGTSIAVVLILNGVVRLWFAQDDTKDR